MLLSLLLQPPLGRTLQASRSSSPQASVLRDTPQAVVELLQQHLSEHPTDAAALLELGAVWELLGLPLSAAECLTSAIEHAPDASLAATAHERLGALLAAEDQPGEAEVALREAVALDETRGACLHPTPVASSLARPPPRPRLRRLVTLGLTLTLTRTLTLTLTLSLILTLTLTLASYCME